MFFARKFGINMTFVLIIIGIILALVVGGIILAIVLITSKSKKKNEIPSGIICPKCGCLNNTEYCGECGNKLR